MVCELKKREAVPTSATRGQYEDTNYRREPQQKRPSSLTREGQTTNPETEGGPGLPGATEARKMRRLKEVAESMRLHAVLQSAQPGLKLAVQSRLWSQRQT